MSLQVASLPKVLRPQRCKPMLRLSEVSSKITFICPILDLWKGLFCVGYNLCEVYFYPWATLRVTVIRQTLSIICQLSVARDAFEFHHSCSSRSLREIWLRDFCRQMLCCRETWRKINATRWETNSCHKTSHSLHLQLLFFTQLKVDVFCCSLIQLGDTCVI